MQVSPFVAGETVEMQLVIIVSPANGHRGDLPLTFWHPSFCLSVSQSVRPSVSLSVCQSVCLSVTPDLNVVIITWSEEFMFV